MRNLYVLGAFFLLPGIGGVAGHIVKVLRQFEDVSNLAEDNESAIEELKDKMEDLEYRLEN